MTRTLCKIIAGTSLFLGCRSPSISPTVSNSQLVTFSVDAEPIGNSRAQSYQVSIGSIELAKVADNVYARLTIPPSYLKQLQIAPSSAKHSGSINYNGSPFGIWKIPAFKGPSFGRIFVLVLPGMLSTVSAALRHASIAKYPEDNVLAAEALCETLNALRGADYQIDQTPELVPFNTMAATINLNRIVVPSSFAKSDALVAKCYMASGSKRNRDSYPVDLFLVTVDGRRLEVPDGER